MSHTSAIKSIKIQSISALRAAIEELSSQGVRANLIENATPRAYYNDQQGMGVAPFVIQLPQAKYDIGVYPTSDGGYEMRTDFFGGSVAKEVGVVACSSETSEQAKLGKIFQYYALNAAEEQARNQGLMTQRVTGDEGAIELVLTGY